MYLSCVLCLCVCVVCVVFASSATAEYIYHDVVSFVCKDHDAHQLVAPSLLTCAHVCLPCVRCMSRMQCIECMYLVCSACVFMWRAFWFAVSLFAPYIRHDALQLVVQGPRRSSACGAKSDNMCACMSAMYEMHVTHVVY